MHNQVDASVKYVMGLPNNFLKGAVLSFFVFAGNAATGQITMTVPFLPTGPSTALLKEVLPTMSRLLGNEISVQNVKVGSRDEVQSAILSFLDDASNSSRMLMADTNTVMLFKEAYPEKDVLRDSEIIGVIGERPLLLVVQKGGIKSIEELRVSIKDRGTIAHYGSNSVVGRCARLLATKLGVPQTRLASYPDPIATVASVADGTSMVACIEAHASWNNVAFLAINRSMPSAFGLLPTMKDQGLDLGLTSLAALFMPRGSAPEALKAARTALEKTLQDPSVRARINSRYYIVD